MGMTALCGQSVVAPGGAAQALRRCVYGGGKVLPGLVLRRQAEVSFLSASGQS
jgi:GH24 family phage-related lysozyme (muramidase)